MTIAILSDVHLGDKSSRILNNNGEFHSSNHLYRKLKEKIFTFTSGKPLRFLVLSGDIMDFTINSIESSINISRIFFKQISSDRIADRIVYIPGNHDKQVWDGVQWDTSVIGNLSDNRSAKPFNRIQTAVINNLNSIELPGVNSKAKGKYGDIFLKGLFDTSEKNPEIILAYPNLYINKCDETILVTHGHMFETKWVLISNLLKGVCGLPAAIGLKELEEWNIPLSSMLATGLGSGGPVSGLFYRIERETYEKKTGTLSKTLDKVIPRIKDELNLPWYQKMLIPDWLIRKAVIYVALKSEDPRAYDNFLDNKKNSDHFRDFIEASDVEVNRLGLPPVRKIIFGHTHRPYGSTEPYKTSKFPEMEFYNTGGWLKENSAEVFLIGKNRFESFSI